MPSIDPELAALLSVLADRPEDDLLWMAVADWLEEHGETERSVRRAGAEGGARGPGA